MRLTKANVAKLSLPEGKSELLVFDEALAGFGIRLRYGGKRTWIAQYRLGSKQRRTVARLDRDARRRGSADAGAIGAFESQSRRLILRSKIPTPA